MKKPIVLLISMMLALFIIEPVVMAQQTAIYQDPDAAFNSAVELFDSEKYGAAQRIFDEISRNISAKKPEIAASASYYGAVCALRLSNRDAGTRLESFIKEYPTSSRRNQTYFHLGNFYFAGKSYRSASQAYDNTDAVELPGSLLAEYFYKSGYASFEIGNTAKAKERFLRIKDQDSDYGKSASYYYGHIAYSENKFETALNEFKKLTKTERYKKQVPYYIAQIYYRQGKYDDLLEVAPPLLKNTSGKEKADIARMIGDAHYRKANYSDALEYFEMYRANTRTQPSREESYQLAYASYKTNDFKKAAGYFEIVADRKDSLAQNALYHLGDCYLKNGKKSFAQKAFFDAYQLAYDQVSKEDALFNYAKLCYELSADPYNEAISALKRYLNEYPNSRRSDEANKYLVNLALITKNYSDALIALENIKVKDTKLKTAQQKVLYFRGIELFNGKKYREAIEHFDKAIQSNYDPEIKPMALYWTGESWYRIGNFEKALSSYNNFLLLKGTYSTPEYPLTHYGVGYCLFKTGKYDQAGISFRKFINHPGAKDPVMVNDAYLRSADCYFVARDYSSAIINYEKVIKSGGFDGDYAFYQISLAYGVQKAFDKKQDVLQDMIRKYPKSPLVDDAYYELALTSLIQNRNQDAMEYLQKILTNYPASNFTSKAMLRKGLIFYNDNQNEKALDQLKQVVTKFPGTPDAKEALVTISNIYVELNRVNDYLTYVSKVPFASVSMGKQDSLLYVAAENQYLKGDCETSSKGFFNYLEKYPDGVFATTAAYYMGDCASRMGKQEEALRAFETVLRKSDNKFTEKAYARAAAILYKKNELPQALSHYRRLEKYSSTKNSILDALQGQMRIHFQMNSYDSAMIFAGRFMASEKISQEQIIEGHSIMAKSAFQTGNTKLAEKEFGILTKIAQNEAAAEAQYYIALLAFERKDIAQAEKATFKLINDFPAMDYWRVKGFILLSDVYVANGNVFQAKQTLQSIVDNYEGADLREIAKQKLALLK